MEPIFLPPLPPLDRDSGVTLQRQLYDALREAILQGRLGPGERLPSTRHIAEVLNLGRNTVAAAYEQLAADGFLIARQGSGNRVADLPPTPVGGNAGEALVSGERPINPRVAALAGALSERRGLDEAGAFALGPDTASFPWAEWGRLLARRWRKPPADGMGRAESAGSAPLRREIASWLTRSRAVAAREGNLVITAGAQHGVDLIARLLVTPGARVLIEDPCYPGLRASLLAAGAELVPVPVGAEGFDIALAEEICSEARIAIVTPSHQMPLGATMPLARRLALIDWARRKQGWIIEDDYDSDFRYAGPPLASLQGMDAAQRTLYVGSFSVSMFGALRLGYVVLPEDMMQPFATLIRLADGQPSIILQDAMAAFMREGFYFGHLRRMRDLYQSRQAALLAALGEHARGLLHVKPAEAGLHLPARLHPRLKERPAIDAAAEAGIHLRGAAPYYADPNASPGIVLLGYAALPEAQMQTAARRLAAVLERLLKA